MSIFCVIIIAPELRIAHNLYTILVSFTYFMCFYTWIKGGNRAISLYTFFLAYSFFCNCSQQFLCMCGIPTELLSSYYWSNETMAANGLRYQLLCIAALNVGASLYVRKKSHVVSIQEQTQKWLSYSDKQTSHIDFQFVLTLICLAGTLVSAVNTYQLRSSMSYHEFMYGGNEDLNVMFYFSYFFGFFSLKNVFQHRHIWLIYSSWFVLAVVYLLMGTRTQAIPYISFFCITLPVTNNSLFKKKNIPFAIVMGLAFVLFLGMISATREELGTSLTSESQGISSDFIMAISDIGASSITNALTIEIVKSNGCVQSILYFLLTVLPSRTFKISSDFIDELLPFSNLEACSSPGTYISDMAGGQGLGFSFIAETYLNYRWMGFLFVFIYGYLIAYLENHSYKAIIRNNYFPIAFLLLLTRQIFFARADLWLSNNYVEYLVYTYIVYKIIDSVNLKKNENIICRRGYRRWRS